MAYTLNTIDRPAVCFQQNQRDEVRNLGEKAGAITAQPGGNQNYVCVLNDQGGAIMGVSDKAGTLRAQAHSHQPIVCYAPEGNHCGAYREDDKSATLQTKYHYGGGGDAALVIENHPADSRVDLAKDNVIPILTGRMGTGGGNVPMILQTYVQPKPEDFKENGAKESQTNDISENGRGAVRERHETGRKSVCGTGQADCFTMRRFGEYVQGGALSTLMVRDCKHSNDVIVEGKPSRKYIVRRLTPLECCRLQGFPDGWCDGVEGSDSAQYRMWGNGIALPCAADVLGRIAKAVEKGG